MGFVDVRSWIDKLPKLSELEIDVDKDWGGRPIVNLGTLALDAIPPNIPIKDYEYTGIFWSTLFDTIEPYAGAGVGGMVINEKMMRVYTGTALGNSYYATRAPEKTIVPSSWDKKRRFKTAAEFSSVTLIECWLCCGWAGAAYPVDTHFGFRYVDGTLYGTVADGVAQSTLNLGTVAAGTIVALEAVHTPAVECRFYVDGVDKGALTTNLPTGIAFPPEYIIYIEAKTGEAVSKDIRLTEYRFIQEP